MVVDITHTCRAGIVILVRLRRLHRHGRSLHLGDYLRRYLRHLRGLRILWGLLWGLGDLDAGLGVRVNIWVLRGGLETGLELLLLHLGRRVLCRQGGPGRQAEQQRGAEERAEDPLFYGLATSFICGVNTECYIMVMIAQALPRRGRMS